MSPSLSPPREPEFPSRGWGWGPGVSPACLSHEREVWAQQRVPKSLLTLSQLITWITLLLELLESALM